MSTNSKNKVLRFPAGKQAARFSRVEDLLSKISLVCTPAFKTQHLKKKKRSLPQVMCLQWVSSDAANTVQQNWERKYAPPLMCCYVKPGPAVCSSTFVVWFLQLPTMVARTVWFDASTSITGLWLLVMLQVKTLLLIAGCSMCCASVLRKIMGHYSSSACTEILSTWNFFKSLHRTVSQDFLAALLLVASPSLAHANILYLPYSNSHFFFPEK